MEKEHIEGAKKRAQLVVDGMVRVKDQQARDVLKMAEHIELQDQVIRLLENKLNEIQEKDREPNYMSAIFGSEIFK